MSGSRATLNTEMKNERGVTDGPARSRTISSWRYPIRAPNGAGNAALGRSSGESGDCRGRAAPGLQRPGTQPDYVVFY